MEMIVVTSKELRTLLREEVAGAIAQIKPTPLGSHDNEPFLRREDIATMFGVTLVTVHNWMNAGKLPYHRMGGRVYFKKSEVLESFKSVKLRKKS